jgi:hypothetical protein
MWSRRLELVCGALCGALGLALLGVWLFAPLGMKLISTRGIQGPLNVPASFWQLYGLASLLSPITAVSGLALGVVVFALWHGLARSLSALVLLWGCTALLWVACVATVMALLPNISDLFAHRGGGVLFVLLVLVPVLALVASIAGTVTAWQRVPAHM